MSHPQDLNPGRIFSLASGYWQPCALHAAVKLKIFTVLADTTLTSQDVAQKVNASPRGVEMLLNALVALELLENSDKGFRNTLLSRTFLDSSSPKYTGHIVMHHHHMVDGWARLDESVVSGEPLEDTWDHGEEQEREAFLMGMYNLSMAIAPQLSKEIDLTGRKHLLDLGGGPGTHAVHFCMATPGLKATIFDRHTTRPFAEKTAQKFGMQDRIDFASGDFNHDPIPGTYDVTWLSHILHSNAPEECQRLINKTASVMEPGGLMMIHDFLLNDTMDGPQFPALFSLNMLLNNRGRSYSEKEVGKMMEQAGLNEIRRLPFQAPNDSGVLVGTL